MEMSHEQKTNFEECCKKLEAVQKSFKSKLKQMQVINRWTIRFGKYKGKTYSNVIASDMNYIKWMLSKMTTLPENVVEYLTLNKDMTELEAELRSYEMYIYNKNDINAEKISVTEDLKRYDLFNRSEVSDKLVTLIK